MENKEPGRKQLDDGPSMTTNIDREEIIRGSTTESETTEHDISNEWAE